MEKHVDRQGIPPERRFGGLKEKRERRTFVGMLFDCCNVYSRIYVNRSKTAYVGWCPKCGRRAEVKIGKDGTDCRMFRG